MKVRFHDINWDTSDPEQDEGSPIPDLPTETTLQVEDDVSLETEGADVLSNKYGFCVFSFDYEIVESRQFHRTVITVEVLSEGPYEPETLTIMVLDIIKGDCSGGWSVTKSERVDAKTMAKLLLEQGSHPTFFNLDEDGNEVEE